MKRDKLIIITQNGQKKINIEIPESMEEFLKGLLERKSIPANSGMLFCYTEKEQLIQMTTTNMLFSLDFVFIDEDGTISKIYNNIPANVEPISYEGVKAVLELPGGTCSANNIKLLDIVKYTCFTRNYKKQPVADDIDFNFKFTGYGWADVELTVGDKTIKIKDISYLCNPLRDIMTSLLGTIYSYAKNTEIQRKFSFTWEGEPMTCYWEARVYDLQWINIKITHNGKILLNETLSYKKFLYSVVKGIDELLAREGIINTVPKWGIGYVESFSIYDYLLLKYYATNNKPFDLNCDQNERNLKEELALIQKRLK